MGLSPQRIPLFTTLKTAVLSLLNRCGTIICQIQKKSHHNYEKFAVPPCVHLPANALAGQNQPITRTFLPN